MENKKGMAVGLTALGLCALVSLIPCKQPRNEFIDNPIPRHQIVKPAPIPEEDKDFMNHINNLPKEKRDFLYNSYKSGLYQSLKDFLDKD